MTRFFGFSSVAAVVLSACGGAYPLADGGTGGGAGGGSVGTAKYDLNDVSFLYPLPAAADKDLLLGMTAQGTRGELFPKSLYAQVPELLPGQDRAKVYDALKVVSARVDPCFPLSSPPAAPVCQRQIRLVAQPVLQGSADAGVPATQLLTEDASVHLFFEMSDAQWNNVKAAVAELRALAGEQTKGQPLDIHPVMKAQGLNGVYAKKLNALLLAECGQQNLVKVAFMALNSFGFFDQGRWTFGIFNRPGGVGPLVEDTIPRTGGKTVQGFTQDGSETSPAGDFIPTPAGDQLTTLIEAFELAAADELTLQRALKAALKMENPAHESPRTIDCASCHVATRSRSHAEEKRGVSTVGWAERFEDGRFDLRRVDGAKNRPDALRAFGYFRTLSALSQRTINESAVIAIELSK